MWKNIRKLIKGIIPEQFKFLYRVKKQSRDIAKLHFSAGNRYEAGKYPHGVNLIGPLNQPTGLGQGCRLVKRELQAAGIEVSSINYAKASDSTYKGNFVYDINLIQVNMHEFAGCLSSMKSNELAGRHNIAFWSWEAEEFPERWHALIGIVDEIWTPSEYTSNSIRKATRKPVISIPFWVTAESDEGLNRKFFSLPDKEFLFLLLFDKGSSMERKNPFGTIQAFKKAFAGIQDVGLVVRISDVSSQDMEMIRNELKGFSVYFVTQELSKEALNRLIQLCDCYVSMHRAEGYGLVLAEAMILGTPTIATGYSANTEFQNRDNACLVDAVRVEIDHNVSLYPKGSHWAEPDIDQCAQYMRKIYSDKGFRERIKENAKRDMTNPGILRNAVETIISRCNAVWNPTVS